VSLLDVRPAVLITGLSASGKSTVGDLLARHFERGVHVKGDVYRRMIVSGGVPMSAAPSEEAWRQYRLRCQLGAATADAYHDAGFAVVVQDVIVGPVLVDYVSAIRSRPRIVVVLAPRPEVILAREQQRSKNAYPPGEASVVVEWDAAFRRETPALGLWLDTSDQTPLETVATILDRGMEGGAFP